MRFLGENTGHKTMLTLKCEMERINAVTGEVEQTDDAHFNTLQVPVYRAMDLESMYETMKAKMLESFSSHLRIGSGWTLKKVKELHIKLSRNRVLRGSSYLSHPKGPKTRSLINIENKKDDLCLAWSILRLMYPIDDKNGNPKYIKDLKPHFNELNLDGIGFPTPCCERTFKRLEKNNNFSLAVYGHEVYTKLNKKGEEVEKVRIIPLYVPTERRKEIYRVFFYKNEDGTKWHYNPITNLRGLVSGQVRNHNKGCSIFICDYCLNYFGMQVLLDEHEECCSQYKAVKTILPKPGKDDSLVFRNIQNCIECPIKFYFDTESILIPIYEMRGKTKLYQRHKMSAFYIYPVLRMGDDSVKIDPVEAIGSDESDDVSRILVEGLVGKAKEVYEKFKVPIKMIFDADARASYEGATVCYACNRGFNDDNEAKRKVRDHCHFTGRYRGALHSERNLKLRQRPFVIPVFAHNLSGYDSHMFVKLLAEMEGGVDCIRQNEEKYMSFSKNVLVDVVDGKNVYVKLEFKDTFRFLNKSLSYLVEATTDFNHTDKYFTKEQQEVLRSKQHYPYEYMTSFSRMKETVPPPKEAFDSSLNLRGVVSEFADSFDEMERQKMSDDDYRDFLKSYEVSESKTLGDFTMFYVRGDTYQLADVFENFIDVFMNLFGLDPSHYISAPHYFQDAMLKVTGEEIPLLTHPDMHLLFEDGKRGGVTLAMKRRMVVITNI